MCIRDSHYTGRICSHLYLYPAEKAKIKVTTPFTGHFVSFSPVMTKLLWSLPLSFLLTACPFESNMPLEKAPVEPVDSSLLGFWYGIVKDGSDYFGIEALEINRQSDSLYSVIRYGKAVKGDMILPDTSFYTAYSSRIRDQSFMNLAALGPDGKPSKVWYLSLIHI